MITINHERFGDATRFETLDEARDTIRACGPEFASVTLDPCGTSIVDERGEVVGSFDSLGVECPSCNHVGPPVDDEIGCGCHCAECGERL
jgi:hypothetical protein